MAGAPGSTLQVQVARREEPEGRLESREADGMAGQQVHRPLERPGLDHPERQHEDRQERRPRDRAYANRP